MQSLFKIKRRPPIETPTSTPTKVRLNYKTLLTDVSLVGSGRSGGGTDEQLEEYKVALPYQKNVFLFLLKVLLVCLTGGLFGLVLLWNFKSRFWFERACNVEEADKFLILGTNGEWRSVDVLILRETTKYFEYNGLRYLYDPIKRQYVIPPLPFEVGAIDTGAGAGAGAGGGGGWTHQHMLSMRNGLRSKQIDDRFLASYGKNLINVPTNPVVEDYMNELLQPDYIYIYLCCILWLIHEYAVFSSIILLSSIAGGAWDVWNRRVNRLHIKKMACYVVDVKTLRNGKWKVISSDNLVPGDVVELQGGGWKVPCDFVLVTGLAIVDESTLTGESIPVVKQKLGEHPHKLYDPEKDKKYTIYGGTTIVGAVGEGEEHHTAPGGDVLLVDIDEREGPTKRGHRTGGGASAPLAVVVRTGWRTAKGSLIRSILNVSQQDYIYERHAKIFLGLLALLGVGFFFLSLGFFGTFTTGVPFDSEKILYGFEAIAILVPPMLPTLFQIGLVESASVLQREHKVFTTDSSRIPLSGKVNMICFDKTGTLTKDDLDMMGVVCHDGRTFGQVQPVPSVSHEVLKSLVCCHQLGELNPELIGSVKTTMTTDARQAQPSMSPYSGPVVDMKIFESTSWRYHDATSDSDCAYVESPYTKERMEIVKRFDFDPVVQRMSVIARDPTEEGYVVYCKGSPEMIRACCNPSTLPKNYLQESKKHSREGCYVLALATKRMASVTEQDRRGDIERNLRFLGFVLLRNELKPETAEAVRQLKQGRVKMSIITGDNIYTAFYIAKQCGIVSPKKKCFIGDFKKGELVFYDAYKTKRLLDITTYSVTDKDGVTQKLHRREVAIGLTANAWEFLKGKGNEEFIINEVKIFARMKPLQKEAVIKMVRGEGHIVGMCGDGANDCAALSAAHCGIALSEAEASVVSPFTAKRLSISSVVDLVREARACLASSFAIFRCTIIYGISQTVQALFCYSYGADFSEYQYILIDFILFLPSAYFVTKSLSSNRLQANPPTSRIFGPRTLSSMLGNVLLSIFSLLITHFILHQQPWYTPPTSATSTVTAVHMIPEVTSTWLVGSFTYPIAALVCSFGGRWRKPFYHNIGLLCCVFLSLLLINIIYWVLPVWDPLGLYGLLQFVELPLYFRGILYGIAVGTVVSQVIWEYIFVNRIGDLMGETYGIGRGPVDDENWPQTQAIGAVEESSEEDSSFILESPVKKPRSYLEII